jgi:hypothetical protein
MAPTFHLPPLFHFGAVFLRAKFVFLNFRREIQICIPSILDRNLNLAVFFFLPAGRQGESAGSAGEDVQPDRGRPGLVQRKVRLGRQVVLARVALRETERHRQGQQVRVALQRLQGGVTRQRRQSGVDFMKPFRPKFTEDKIWKVPITGLHVQYKFYGFKVELNPISSIKMIRYI